MKSIFMSLLIVCFLWACRPERKAGDQNTSVENAENKLHGVWESVIIRTREKIPPKKVVLRITTHNKSKLIWLKMLATGPRGQEVETTIQVNLEEKNGASYIVPIVRKQVEKSLEKKDKKFINYNPKHRKEMVGLEWEYTLADDQLIIRMGMSSITFKRAK